MRGHAVSRGFTIIELTLAMTFVSILLIAVAMLSIQLSNQYSRGLTLKEIAQSGTEAANDMKRTLAQAQVGDVGIIVRSIPSEGGWILCTGEYSYVANSPKNLEENNNQVITIGSSKTPARLAKVNDPSGSYCTAPYPLESPAGRNITKSDVTELLPAGSRLLVVRNLDITPNGKPADGSIFANEFAQGRGIYTVTLTIGTGVRSEIETFTEPSGITSSRCKAPSSKDSNLEYCAIDTFKFTTRVGSTNR